MLGAHDTCIKTPALIRIVQALALGLSLVKAASTSTGGSLGTSPVRGLCKQYSSSSGSGIGLGHVLREKYLPDFFLGLGSSTNSSVLSSSGSSSSSLGTLGPQHPADLWLAKTIKKVMRKSFVAAKKLCLYEKPNLLCMSYYSPRFFKHHATKNRFYSKEFSIYVHETFYEKGVLVNCVIKSLEEISGKDFNSSESDARLESTLSFLGACLKEEKGSISRKCNLNSLDILIKRLRGVSMPENTPIEHCLSWDCLVCGIEKGYATIKSEIEQDSGPNHQGALMGLVLVYLRDIKGLKEIYISDVCFAQTDILEGIAGLNGPYYKESVGWGLVKAVNVSEFALRYILSGFLLNEAEIHISNPVNAAGTFTDWLSVKKIKHLSLTTSLEEDKAKNVAKALSLVKNLKGLAPIVTETVGLTADALMSLRGPLLFEKAKSASIERITPG
ncbi:hypothetical protein NEDG_01585 [Nematocida displodere]|uniref:Uncharacterized protein n=1 Tax=Nematocida displodere TaxID=1805483 RepID=A0A177EJ69_9MICR|nr:hypothetical protein NEDG_01585 [Nematocida displodere]